ncbi:MAG: SDR family NAD(P)-dependent oxidoreductase [Fuerstiella sp.]|jgi:NAD(P)-dependent dehydrogenase (short-subunit alcohol dehydrogenase family)|nr:SDR family NAD(P)-dependent oxidoreductase [Fuerstiella sp.]
MTTHSKTVVVTGVASGIGKATALNFAAQGCAVIGADLQYSDENRARLETAGVTCLVADVRSTASIECVVNGALADTSRLDVLVNNAGMGMVKQIGDVSETDWDTVMDTNLKAAFFGCKAAIAAMLKQPSGGSIINVASNAGLLPRSHDPVYSISKMALVGLTKSLALCHSKDRIRINCVCPGPVENTQMIEENFVGRSDRQEVVRELIQASPLARAWDRMISPGEVADSILYLASEAAHMVSGTAIAIDGGKSLGVPPD